LRQKRKAKGAGDFLKMGTILMRFERFPDHSRNLFAPVEPAALSRDLRGHWQALREHQLAEE
jgi:hypothetical protein